MSFVSIIDFSLCRNYCSMSVAVPGSERGQTLNHKCVDKMSEFCTPLACSPGNPRIYNFHKGFLEKLLCPVHKMSLLLLSTADRKKSQLWVCKKRKDGWRCQPGGDLKCHTQFCFLGISRAQEGLSSKYHMVETRFCSHTQDTSVDFCATTRVWKDEVHFLKLEQFNPTEIGRWTTVLFRPNTQALWRVRCDCQISANNMTMDARSHSRNKRQKEKKLSDKCNVKVPPFSPMFLFSGCTSKLVNNSYRPMMRALRGQSTTISIQKHWYTTRFKQCFDTRRCWNFTMERADLWFAFWVWYQPQFIFFSKFLSRSFVFNVLCINYNDMPCCVYPN